MPTPNQRPSLTNTLEGRYASQHAGGAFEVKDRIGKPGEKPLARMPVDGNEVLYTVDDFVTRWMLGVTELLDAQEANSTSAPKSKELSLYIKGFDNTKYKP